MKSHTETEKPIKPLKRMNEDELLWAKTCLIQKRRKLDERIKKLNWALGMYRFEKGKE